ncbi:MAG: HEAT repeat domain-containing protein [Nitrospirae bacterium]|nr:HEAT repeat domain-containing protein [Nitrospirota bacterium]
MHNARLARLIKNLSHHDPSKRRSAAEALSEGDERAVYPLIKALGDDNLGVQDAATHSLMAIKNEVTAYMMLPLLREDSYLRNTALIILREMGNFTIPLLIVLLNDKDDDVRKFAINLICDIQYCNYPDKLVEMLKNDPNANVRAAAAKTLGVLNYKKAIPQLVNALKDDEWVCFSAIEALTVLKDEDSIDSIVTLLNNPSEAIRFAAIEALGKIGSPLAEHPLLEYISRADEFERKATVMSLVQVGMIPSSPNISVDLIEMLKNGDWEEKFIAIKGLLILREDRAIYHMIDIAGSMEFSAPDREEKVQVIKEAVFSFGCNDYLLKILEDDTFRYRGKSLAIEIVGDLKCTAAVSNLIKLVKSNYRDIKRASINSLSQIESEEAKEYLIEAVSDEDSHVRKSAIIALGKIAEMSAFEPLMKLLRNEIYSDIIDEFIKSLLNINSTLFFSRISGFNKNIQEIAARYTSSYNSERKC